MTAEKQKTIIKKIEAVEQEVSETVEQVADDLQVGLPTDKTVPFGIRLIIFITLAVGIATIAGVFSESYSGSGISLSFYFFRLSIGFFLLIVAYGLHRKKLYAVWLLAAIIILGTLLNPFASLLPIVALVYLYQERSRFAVTREFIIPGWKIKL